MVVTIEEKLVMGNKLIRRGTLVLAASYSAGGESVLPNDFGVATIDHLELSNGAAAAGTTALNAQYDRTNATIQLFETAAVIDLPHAETNVADASTFVINWFCVGH